MNFKYDVKIYGIEERKENILKNKEILGLSDEDIFINKPETRYSPESKWPYTACKKAFTQPVPDGVTHRLVLQDDVELCPNFSVYLNLVINTHPDVILMLTSADFDCPNSYVDNLKTPYIEVGYIIQTCALLIPIKYINDIFNWIEDQYPQIAIGNPHEDIAVRRYAKVHNIKYITTVPALTQHLGDISSICHYVEPYRAYYFSDWENANWDSKEIATPYLANEQLSRRRKELIQETNDNSIHYFVRTTGERNFNYYPLKTILLYDYEHKPLKSFIKQLETISIYNSVLLEDDVILCNNFQEEIEKVIAQYPNKIIQFFSDIYVYNQISERLYPFQWNQCTYYPKGVAKLIADKMKSLIFSGQFDKDYRLYSHVESEALRQLGITHIVYKPCLVQHKVGESILQPNEFKNRRDSRGTAFFIDYIKELDITYNEAGIKENTLKLREIRDKHLYTT